MVFALASGSPGADGTPAAEALLHPSGETAARLMILAMMLTPLRMLFPRAGIVQWLLRRRRWIGVAAFAYAAFHLALYVIDMDSLRAMLGEAFELGIWTGWVAFFVMVPLAVTSNDASVRWLGARWKPLQRAVYGAAVLTLLHWIFVQDTLGPALVHALPLAALEAWRITRTLGRSKSTA